MAEQEGSGLLHECKRHLLKTMASLPECAPDGPGATNAELERAAGFALDLPEQDHWFTWSILKSLELDGKVEVATRGTRRKRYYRLAPREG